jgi:hypothetical protein
MAERHIRQLQRLTEIGVKLLQACGPAAARAVETITREIRLNLIQQGRIEAKLRKLKAASRETATGGANLSASKPATRPGISAAGAPTVRSEWRPGLPCSPTKH